MATVYDGQPSSTYHAFIPTRTNPNISLRTPKTPSHYTPPSNSVKVLPPKEASDQKQALLSLPTPQAGNAEHSLDIESSRTRKSLVNDAEDLQARWERFLENHEKDVCMVTFTLKFACSRIHIRAGISKCWLGSLSDIECR
jgi:hypothetical protein